METSNGQVGATTAEPAAPAPAQHAASAQPSLTPSKPVPEPEPSISPTANSQQATTVPSSTASQTPIQKEQEEFEGVVDVNNDLPSKKILQQVGDLVVLDAEGQSRPFRELYNAPHVAPRQLIIFIRHFFCGNCQEYLRTLSSSITPDALLALPTPTFITVIGCGKPELISMYTETTSCPFPIYADPTRKIYDLLGMTRTFTLGSKPEYMHTNMLINSIQSIFQGLATGKHALKGGDMKQVGGEFLFEHGECTWVHRMKTTRGHSEVSDLRTLLGLDGTRPPMRKRWSHAIKEAKSSNRRSMSWGRLQSKRRGSRDAERDDSGKVTPEKMEEESREVEASPKMGEEPKKVADEPKKAEEQPKKVEEQGDKKTQDESATKLVDGPAV